ncbi:HNH endonuclease signature motif containing protein [Microbacterium aoyamense]|uniref:HNH endonuclease signature motif containing protein n=1 Tax=Microbacterium aoyamense TaxID=344166 RepID=A0ABP5AYI8_9MICO|nr:HNH endonuclease signature motif containing protein [Microbacterium aoyamense]
MDLLTPDEAAVLDGVVTALVEARRGIAAFQALEASLLASAMALGVSRADGSRGDGDMPVREIAAEIAAALRVSDRTVERRLVEAQRLATRFPATLIALTDGRVSRAHVDVIVAAGERIEDAGARAVFEQAVLVVAERESASRLRPVALLLAERVMPTTLTERHESAREERRVEVQDLDDGMAQLLAVLPAALAHGIRARLSAMATAVKDADPAESRSHDQLRADLLSDLLLAGEPSGHDADGQLGAIRAEVHVTVPVLSLAGVDSAPAVIEGSAPIDPDTARVLCAGAPGWERVLTHPVTGTVLAVDRYRPSADLRRTLRARDQRCRFPGCRVTAAHCDIDHVHDHAHGGATAHDNLAHVCRRHHTLKHHSAWTVTLTADRTMTWRSPTGREYPESPAPPGIAFTTDGDPPPF